MTPDELDDLFRPLARQLNEGHMQRLGIFPTMQLASTYNHARYGRQEAWRRSLYDTQIAALLEENGRVTRPPIELHDGWAGGLIGGAPNRPVLQLGHVASSLLRHKGMKTPRWRILIIDDHAQSRAAVAEAVGSQGGTVVGNGSRVEDAVRLVDKHRPDVLLLAVGLPDGDGVEAARRVMATLPCAIVLLTSHADPDVSARAVDAGVLGFLVKPLRSAELGPALDVAVRRFRELEAVRKENEALKQKLESRKLVDRAKGLLMTRLGLSEPEAFRRIQKTAMDSRKTMADVAQALLLADGMGPLRSAR